MAGLHHGVDLLGDIGELGHVGIDHRIAWRDLMKRIDKRHDPRTFCVGLGTPTGAGRGDFFGSPAGLGCSFISHPQQIPGEGLSTGQNVYVRPLPIRKNLWVEIDAH